MHRVQDHTLKKLSVIILIFFKETELLHSNEFYHHWNGEVNSSYSAFIIQNISKIHFQKLPSGSTKHSFKYLRKKKISLLQRTITQWKVPGLLQSRRSEFKSWLSHIVIVMLVGFHSCRRQVMVLPQICCVWKLLATKSNSPALRVDLICFEIVTWQLVPKMLSKIDEYQPKDYFLLKPRLWNRLVLSCHSKRSLKTIPTAFLQKAKLYK